MNRRRFLTSVPVLAAYGFVVAMVGRLFGTHPKRQFYCTLAPCQPDKLGCTKVFEPYCSTRAKRMSAGRLRREPEAMAGGDAGQMASWEDGPKPKAEIGPDGGFVMPPHIAEQMRRHRPCPKCGDEQDVILWQRRPIFTGGKDGCAMFRPGPMVVTLKCGHELRLT